MSPFRKLRSVSNCSGPPARCASPWRKPQPPSGHPSGYSSSSPIPALGAWPRPGRTETTAPQLQSLEPGPRGSRREETALSCFASPGRFTRFAEAPEAPRTLQGLGRTAAFKPLSFGDAVTIGRIQELERELEERRERSPGSVEGTGTLDEAEAPLSSAEA